MSDCDSIRPECVAELVTLSTQQKTLTTDVRELKTTVRELELRVERQEGTLNGIDEMLTNDVVPSLKMVPIVLQQYRDECPVMQALTDDQRAHIDALLKQKGAKNEKRENKTIKAISSAIDNQAARAIFLALAAAIGALITYFFGEGV